MKVNRLAVFAVFCGVGLSGQSKKLVSTTGSAKAQDAMPVETIDLSKGKQIAGLPNTNIMGYPAYSSGDGTLFVAMYDPSTQTSDFVVADLYSISADGTVTKVRRDFPQQMDRVEVKSVYPEDTLIATLVLGVPQKTSSDEGRPPFRYFISLSKRDGTFEKLISLDLKFTPLKIAVLGSGRFIALGVDEVNKIPVLALLDTDGTFIRSIDLDNRPFDNSASLQAIYRDAAGGTASTTQIAATSAAFVPFGVKVLFYVPGSKLPVHILGEGGEEDSVQLHLPPQYLLETMLPSDKNDTWVVRAQSIEAFSQLQKSGMISSPEQRLFEVDPQSGNVRKELHVIGAEPGEVAGASNRTLIAIRQTADIASSPAKWLLSKEDR